MTAETRRFNMHQNLLYDVIMRQAGTLQKAILEGVMNAIDAGATICEVELDTHRFAVSDDGHGFQSRTEIEDFFETFGTPHEEGDATYGRFRMGRGQMMAFGKNTWRSRNFEMHVDIKKSGLDYNLIEHDEDRGGTRVEAELYDPIAPSDLERIKAELRNFVAWAQIPVMLNGEQISKLPSEGKWTFEDEHAYYALSSERTQLAVYNLGVLVNSFWSGRFGIGGTIVSKKQLEVNFARNDVQSVCPVFRKISDRIKKEAGTTAAKKTKLTDAERDMLVRQFLSGEIDVTAGAKLRAITDVFGRSWPVDKLTQLGHKFSNRLVVAERGDQLIETAQRRGIAFSVDEATLERFGATDGKAFIKRLAECARRVENNDTDTRDWNARSKLSILARDLERETIVVERDDLKAFISDEHIALENNEITPEFKLMLAAVSRGYQQLLVALNRAQYEDRRFEHRDIRLGRSESALAWTDGQRTIWIDLEHARLLRRGYRGAYQIASTLLHEMLHEGPDTGTHQHDFAFYQAYHDTSSLPEDPLGLAAERMVETFITRLRQHKKKVSKALLKLDDTDHALDTLRADIEDTAAA
jgi:hypothetical protein